MQLIAPDILADLHGLSLPLCATGIAVGLALWLLGWWGHRFWVVLLTTVLAGVYGLAEGQAVRAQPLITALLLAVAAGLLALALVRLAAFAAGGVALLAGVQALMPVGDQALILFLVGGIIGVVLFRLWVMALTSLGGTLLATYAGLCLAEGLGRLDAAAWADKRAVLLNWVCTVATVLGLAVQLVLHRLRAVSVARARGRRSRWRVAPSRYDFESEVADERRSSWPWRGGIFRKAG